jgi:acetaldehyde dehydrogenase (acetylating)
MAIHSNDQPIIMKFALEKPAFRILVNTPSSVGAVGYTTALSPALTLGPGTWGGSIISENVTAKHLINIKSLAFETNPINKGECVTSFDMPGIKGSTSTGTSSFMKEIEDRLNARAGNPHLTEFHKPVREEPKKEEKKVEKGKVYGAGISEEDIKKIIHNFTR